MQVVVQEIPGVQVVERIQEPIVGTFFTNCAPTSPLKSRSRVPSPIWLLLVEASQVVDPFSLLDDFAAPADVTTLNASSTSTSSSSTSTSIDRLDEQLTNILDMLSSYKDVFSPLAAHMESIEKETERVAMLTKR